MPKSNRNFWLNKLNKNKARDEINTKKLKKHGWKVYKIWECKIKQNTNKNADRFLSKIKYVLLIKLCSKIIKLDGFLFNTKII